MNKSDELVKSETIRHSLNLLSEIEREGRQSQRDLSNRIGLSLGKTNFLLKSLVEVGWVKVKNFRRSDNKLGYAYVLTPHGVAEKVRITKRYLRKKEQEYLALQLEIESIKRSITNSEVGS